MIDALLSWHARWVTRRPATVAAGLVATTLAALALLPRLEIEGDLRSLLPADHPAIRLMRATETGDATRTMLLMLRGPNVEGALPELERTLRESPYLEDVDVTRESFLGARALDAELLLRVPPETLDALAAALSPDERRAAIASAKALLAQDPVVGREMLMHDPLGLRWILDDAERALLPAGLDPASPYLVWPARELALARVRGTREPFDVEFSNRLLDDVEARAAEVELDALGGYAVARRDAARIRADMTRSLGWSIPLLVAALALSTRSLVTPLLYVLPTAMAVAWALGLGGAILGPLTPLAVGSAAILMGLGVDFCIHYLDRYRSERARADHAGAVLRAHRGTGRALLLAMATTVSAFVAISFGSFPGTSGFGVLLTLGLASSWIAALSLLPLLARRFGVRAPERCAPALLARMHRFVRSRSARPVVVGGALAATGGWILALGGGLRFDTDPGHLRPVEQRFHAEVGELESALGMSPLALRVLVPSSTEPSAVVDGLERLVRDGVAARVSGDYDAFPSGERRRALERFAAATSGWRAGAEADLAAAGFRPEMLDEGLARWQATLSPPEPALPPPSLEWEGRAYRTVLVHPPRTPRDAGERAELRAAVGAELGAGVEFVDPAGIGDTLGPVLAADLARALVLCAVAILVIVGATLRGRRRAAATLVPVFAGLGVTLGGLALSGFPLHPGNMLALPLILGLGVDDGIHMVLRDAPHRGLVSGDAHALATEHSIWRTTFTTVIGFGSLAFASSPAIASLGALAACGALACFLATMIGVPWMLGPARADYLGEAEELA